MDDTCDYPGCGLDATEVDLDTGVEICQHHHDYTPRPARSVAPRTPRLRGSLRPAPASPYPPGEATVAIGVDWSCTPSKSTVVVCEVQPDGSIHVVAMSDMECGNETTGGQDF